MPSLVSQRRPLSPQRAPQSAAAVDLFSALNPRQARRISLINMERLVDTLSNDQADLLRNSLTHIVNQVDVRGEIDRHNFIRAVEKSTRQNRRLRREGSRGRQKSRPLSRDAENSNPFHQSQARVADNTGDITVFNAKSTAYHIGGTTTVTSPMAEPPRPPLEEIHTAPVNPRVLAEEAGQTEANGRPTAISNFHLRLEAQLQQREENRIQAAEKRRRELERIERKECTFRPKINTWKGPPPRPSNYRRALRERGMEFGNTTASRSPAITSGLHTSPSPGHSMCVMNTSFEERERNQEQSELEQECTFQPNLTKFLTRSKTVSGLAYPWEATATGPRYRERRQRRRFIPPPRSPIRSGKMTTSFWADQLRFSPGDSTVCTLSTSAQNFTKHPHYDPVSKCIHHVINARELRFNQQDWGKYIRAERVHNYHLPPIASGLQRIW